MTLFAKKIAESINSEYRDDILVKVSNTKTQTKKGRFLRWENSKEVFQVGAIPNKKYGHILLVDDVITTGATIESCARMLMGIENVSISVLSMAVVPKG